MRLGDNLVRVDGDRRPTGGSLAPDVSAQVLCVALEKRASGELARVYNLYSTIYLQQLMLDAESVPVLRQPILLNVSPGDDVSVVVFSPVLNIGGVGDDIESAIRDISGTLYSLWEEYRATPPDELAPSAKRLLRRLTSFLPE